LQSTIAPIPKKEPSVIIITEIGLCWMIAIGIGTVPLYFYNKNSQTCYVQDILRWEFLVCRFIAVVVIPLIIIGFVYLKIYKLIRKRVREMPNCSLVTDIMI
jgi:hypothetical protein